MAESENTKDNQRLLEAIVDANVKSLDIEKLKAALHMAKTVTIPKSSHYKALMAIAIAYEKKISLHLAFQYYYSARNFTKNPSIPLASAVKCLNSFFWSHELEFSKNDLSELLSVIQPLHTFLAPNKLKLKNEFALLDKLILRINYRSTYTAKDVVETTVTPPTQKIRNAFYAEMTFDEMQSEFAKFVTLMMINDESSESSEETDEEKEKPAEPTKKKKKKKGSEDED